MQNFKNIRVKCPAKINLTLEIVNRREDGFHNIKSIMQTIDLYDTLDIKICEGENKIFLDGNSHEIPYNETNLVYKAAVLFYKKTGITDFATKIYIDKKIPVAAGLAGGSTDAAGTIFGLNKLFNEPLSYTELHELCQTLGSDLNVCLEGGTILATSRGEVIRKLKPVKSKLTLIKPAHLGISAKEAYTKYAQKSLKPHYDMTEKMLKAIDEQKDISQFLYNDLEYAIFEDYKELQTIKSKLPKAIMSGSGSTYFIIGEQNVSGFSNDEYQIIDSLSFVAHGVAEE